MTSRVIPCSHVYPSGWVHTSSSHPMNPTVVDHDERVTALYDKVTHRVSAEIPVADVLEITLLAKELFTNSDLGANLASRYMTSTAVDLMIDTLNFAVSGHRMISLHSMSSILDMHDVGSVLTSPSSQLDFDSLSDKVDACDSVEELIRQWATRKNGIFDILCTLKLIF